MDFEIHRTLRQNCSLQAFEEDLIIKNGRRNVYIIRLVKYHRRVLEYKNTTYGWVVKINIMAKIIYNKISVKF